MDSYDATLTVYNYDGTSSIQIYNQTSVTAEDVAGNATAYATYNNTYYENTKIVEDSTGADIDGDTVKIGDTLTYEIQWINDATSEGQGAAATVSVSDTIPAGTTFVEGSVKIDGVAASTETTADQYYTLTTDSTTGEVTGITWTLGTQDYGATGTVSFQVTVDESAVDNTGSTISNSGSVTIGTNDPVSTNIVTNKATGKTVENASGTRINGSAINVGDVLTYDITWVNDAIDATTGAAAAATVTITDTIPTGTTFVAGSVMINGVAASSDTTAAQYYTLTTGNL